MNKVTLQEANPELAKQWHPTKNGNLTPDMFTTGSNRKVWWLCSKNKKHEWDAIIYDRCDGLGCPFCSGRKVCDDNCLATLRPDLAQEWHPSKNGNLTPDMFTTGSKRKVWWLCTQNRSHEWQATVGGRNRGSGCPFCAGRKASNESCLATVNPDLAKEWHPTKNGNLTPENVTLHCGKNVWWYCRHGHTWQATVNNRSRGRGCPYCSGKAVDKGNCLATVNPDLAKEWHPTKNGNLIPKNVTSHSNKKVWWLCTKNSSHEWQTTVSDRSNGKGCPYCSGKAVDKGNCLAAVNPDLAKEWHPTKNGNLTPKNVTSHSGKKVWWLCTKNSSHEWQTAVSSRSDGTGCPFCHPNISQLELRTYCELKHLFLSTTSKKKLFGYEYDIYISEIKAGVEVDGVYWHRNKHMKDKKKADAIRDQGIVLIRVRETGLERISDTDIFYSPKDDPLAIIKKIVRSLNEQCILELNKRKALEKYLQRQSFSNDSEYKKLWGILPLPLPGLSLVEQNSDLAKEWHHTKNGGLTPENVTPYSGKKVWWLCLKNSSHEWQTTVADRSNGNGCPFCSGKAVDKGNCLAAVNPDLAKEWHLTKNGRLTPEDVTLHCGKNVWWYCSHRHTWQATVNHRSRGHGCPFCSGRTASNENCLAVQNPDLAKEWHPTKNDNLMPNNVTVYSNKKVWWLCIKNSSHEWQTKVADRSKGHGCPFCSGKAVDKGNCLAVQNPDLAKEWHPTKNGNLTPEDVTLHCGKNVWWYCRHGHIWQATVNHRSRGTGCPKCRGLKQSKSA